MNEKHQLIEHGRWVTDPVYWSIVGAFVLGTISRTFKGDGFHGWKKFFGELGFSCIGASIVYAGGLMQGLDAYQVLFYGWLASLGSVRTIQWTMGFVDYMKKKRND